MHGKKQIDLFPSIAEAARLPVEYTPRSSAYFDVARIVLAKGCDSSEQRRSFVARICELYPEARIIERLDTPHNRIDLEETDPLQKAAKGKSTLVFGEHKSAVRKSEEQGNACPNYRHFSPWGFCFYNCKYCYLSGTRTVWHSPVVKIFLNLPDILDQVDRTAHRIGKPTAFYLGKLQDGLALDPLTGYSSVMVPFFAGHEFARMILLTKSAEVDGLLELEHRGHIALSWSVNPPEIASCFEENVPPVEERLRAMQRCAEKGYPVRAVMMPMIPVPGWEEYYDRFIRQMLSQVPLQRLTMGGICIYKSARHMMEKRMGKNNPISAAIDMKSAAEDGRARYSPELRQRMYSIIIEASKEVRPDIELALCLEEMHIWEKLGLSHSVGRCNCVW